LRFRKEERTGSSACGVELTENIDEKAGPSAGITGRGGAICASRSPSGRVTTFDHVGAHCRPRQARNSEGPAPSVGKRGGCELSEGREAFDRSNKGHVLQ